MGSQEGERDGARRRQLSHRKHGSKRQMLPDKTDFGPCLGSSLRWAETLISVSRWVEKQSAAGQLQEEGWRLPGVLHLFGKHKTHVQATLWEKLDLDYRFAAPWLTMAILFPYLLSGRMCMKWFYSKTKSKVSISTKNCGKEATYVPLGMLRCSRILLFLCTMV